MMADIEQNPLWEILVEVVHSLPLYPSHKAYIRDFILVNNPEISIEELAHRLDIPIGEAIVILRELNHSG